MVKTPRTRHSNAEREPMTIDLAPEDVSRVTKDTASAAAVADEAANPVKEDIGASEISSTEDAVAATDNAPEADRAPESSEAPLHSATIEEPEPTKPYSASSEASYRPQTSGPAPIPQPRRRGSVLTAGVAGGVVALVVSGLMQYAGIFGPPGGSAPAAPEVPATVGTDIAALKSEVEALKAQTDAPDAEQGKIDGLSQSLDQVRSELASLKQAVESGGGGENAAVQALTAKIAEIETKVAGLGQATGGATQEEIAAINQKISGVEALAKSAGEADSAVDSRLGALEQSLSSLAAKVDSQAAQPKIALAIAASALKSAIERGAPFEPEIETFAAIAPQAPGLAELRTYAEKGIASRADILAETDAAAKAMIAAANPPSEDAGYFERLLSSAESLVTVRPVGSVEGPGVPETVARMEVALRAGDLAKAIAEYDMLPEAAKAAGAPFADKIKARLAAEQLADKAIAAAMQAT